LKFPDRFSEKKNYSNTKFNENPRSEAQLFHAGGWTDGQTHDEAGNHFSQYESAFKQIKKIPKSTLEGLPGSHAGQYDTESFRFINV
jgi:hypothetical protein